MMHDCGTDELYPTAAFVHHDDKGHITLKPHTEFNGLVIGSETILKHEN